MTSAWLSAARRVIERNDAIDFARPTRRLRARHAARRRADTR